jgi:PAS domain S-box-containing protein
MKISFEKKIFVGFVINVLVVVVSGWIFISRLDKQRDKTLDSRLNWIELSLFVLSIVLLTIVYFIIRAQLHAKKISQKALLENRYLLKSIIDNTSNPIFIKKINGEYLLINKQYETLFNKSNEEIIGKTDHDFLPSTVADGYRDSDLEVVKKLRELKTEETIEQPDGPHTYIAVKYPLYDSTGRIYAIGGISTDITEWKRLEESSKAADKFFNMSLDIMVIASKDKFIKINPSLSKILGYSEAELLSQPFFTYVHPDDLAITHKEIDKLNTGVITIKFENRWICKDGSVKWFLWSASPDLSTGLLYAIARDVTEKKEIENSLIFANTFFMMSYDMFVVAKGDYFVKVNPAFTKTLGYDQKDMNHKTFLSFTHPEDVKASIDAVKKLQKGVSILNHRARARCKDESYKWLDWTSTFDVQTGMMYAVARDVTKQIESEKSLKIADQFFNMAFEILTVAKDGHFIKTNPAFAKTLGYNQKDLELIKITDVIHPDDKNIADEALSKLLEGNQVINYRDRVLSKDGTYKWLDWSSTIDAKTETIYAVARDVTELIKNEESLKIADQFFNIAFDAFFVSKGNKIIKINPAITKTLGYNQNELEKLSILDLIHPDYVKIVSERMTKPLKGEDVETEVTYPILCKDGSYKWVESMTSTDIKTGITYAVLRDISQKRVNEEKLNLYTQKLKEDEQQLQTFFNGAPDPVIIIDAKSNIIRWNPMAETVFGWKITEVIGKPIYEFIVPTQYRESYKKGMEHFLTTGNGSILNKPTEMEAVNKQGEEFPVSLSVSPVKMREEYFFIGFIRDITENKKTLDELYENEEKLRLIIDNISEGVIVANADKEIVMANYMANEIFGIEEDNKISLNLTDHFELYFPDEKTVFPSQNLPTVRALDGEETNDVDVVLWNPIANEKRRVLISGRPLIDQNNKVVAAVITIKDISRYKKLEEELKETESKYRKLIGFKKGDDKNQ